MADGGNHRGRLRPSPLTFLQALVLNLFAELPGLTPQGLARELGVDTDVMLRLCRELGAAGLISRAG